MSDELKEKLVKGIFELKDSRDGVQGTWIFFKSSLTAEETELCGQLVLEQLKKNNKEVWFMNPKGQPVARGHFELDAEFWSK